MDERVRDFNGLASSWRINRPDTAHSLFEIFDLHLPVLCGELAEEPLGRLPAEITRQYRPISNIATVVVAGFPARCRETCVDVRSGSYAK